MANRESKLVEVELDDLRDHFSAARDGSFLDRVLKNTVRYVELFSLTCDQQMPKPTKNFSDQDYTPFDVIMQQRKFNMEQSLQEKQTQGYIRPGAQAASAQERIPKELDRTYQLVFTPGEFGKKTHAKMRETRAGQLGSLVTMRGIITRASDVKPLMKVAVYVCESCGFEVYQTIHQKQFTPPVECPSDKCKANNIKGNLVMHIRSCRFESYQEIKMQEPSDQVPIGHVPRMIKINARGELTRRCTPGDIVTVTGVYMPQPNFGFRAPGLFQDTFLEAYCIVKDKVNFRDTYLTDEKMERVMDVRGQAESDTHLFHHLAKSICPEIFGMQEVKQALLLLMVGGNTKQMADGMKIRGNVNVLLMGDPGVAKSQLLKHISTFAPRGIYTTGKGSSGVGLTASVHKD